MINILFFLKPIFDMLWQYRIFDMVLLSLLIGFLILNFSRLKLGITTIVIFLLALLFVRSFLVDTSQFADFAKVMSAFIIFTVAYFNKNPEKTIKTIAFSFIIPVAYCLMLFAAGKGFISWGNNLTFVGPYFYKTDLAIMVILSSIFFRYFLFNSENKWVRRLTSLYIFFISPFLIYISNSRTLMIVYLFIFIFIAMESTKTRKIKFSKGIKFLFFIALIALSIVGFQIYNDYSALGISLLSGDIFSAANTQGRNGIWESIINNFFNGSKLNVLFGYYINADFQLNTYLHNDAHNAYLKVLVNTGIVGFVLYVLFCLRVLFLNIKLFKISKNDESKKFISNTILLVFVFYLICGFTQSNIFFTQSTWYSFYLAGLLFNSNVALRSNKLNKIDNNYHTKELKRV